VVWHEKKLLKKYSTEKQETDIRQAVGTATGDRKQRLQTQLATKDFRTSDQFLTDTLSEKRDNRLGLATAKDGGQAIRERNQANAVNVGVAATTGIAAATVLGGGIATAFAAVGTALFPGLGTAIGFAAGVALSFAASQILQTINANNEKEAIKREALNRKETELNNKFKVNQAATPEERAKRQAKVKTGLDTFSKEVDIAQNQAGLNESVIDNLRKQNDPVQKAIVDNIDLFRAKITDFKTESDAALAGLNKNQLDAGLLSEDLTAKANKVLAGSSQINAEDISRIDAELKGRTEELKSRQQALEELLNNPNTDPQIKSAIKSDLAKGAAQIEAENNIAAKLKSKLANRNTDIINQTANGQGIGANVAF
jgi:hypothetical protein